MGDRGIRFSDSSHEFMDPTQSPRRQRYGASEPDLVRDARPRLAQAVAPTRAGSPGSRPREARILLWKPGVGPALVQAPTRLLQGKCQVAVVLSSADC